MQKYCTSKHYSHIFRNVKIEGYFFTLEAASGLQFIHVYLKKYFTHKWKLAESLLTLRPSKM